MASSIRPQTEHETFLIGDRIRLSELGRDRMKQLHVGCGKVIGYGRNSNSRRIKFDSKSYPVTLHLSYLEADPAYRDTAAN